jgi:hypothetical protein
MPEVMWRAWSVSVSDPVARMQAWMPAGFDADN